MLTRHQLSYLLTSTQSCGFGSSRAAGVRAVIVVPHDAHVKGERTQGDGAATLRGPLIGRPAVDGASG